MIFCGFIIIALVCPSLCACVCVFSKLEMILDRPWNHYNVMKLFSTSWWMNAQQICRLVYRQSLSSNCAGDLLPKTISLYSCGVFWLPQLCLLYASGPLFPLSMGPWDWLITSFVREGKKRMSTWLILSVWGWTDKGVFFSLLSSWTHLRATSRASGF